MGLPRPLRLAKSDDFARLRREGQTWRGRFMLINIAPNSLPHNRYGVVTGKKLGGAVIRNRVRRLIRQTLRQATPHLQVGWDIVLVAHPTIVGQSQSDISRAFDTLARQAGLVVSP